MNVHLAQFSQIKTSDESLSQLVLYWWGVWWGGKMVGGGW